MPHGAAGFFGKLPSAGDFVQRRLPSSFLDVWDRHFEGAVAQSRTALGDAWHEAFHASPVWRFLLGPGVCGDVAWAGVMGPGADRVGRCFPMVIAAPVVAADVDRLLASRAVSIWLDEAERIHRAAQSDPAIAVDNFDAQVAALAGPLDGAQSLASDLLPELDWSASSHWRLPWPAAAGAGQVLADLWTQLGNVPGRWCLWWAQAAAGRVPASLLVTNGLPQAEAYAGFLDASHGATAWQNAGTFDGFVPIMATVTDRPMESTGAAGAWLPDDLDLLIGLGDPPAPAPEWPRPGDTSLAAATEVIDPPATLTDGAAGMVVLRRADAGLCLVAAEAGPADPRQQAVIAVAAIAGDMLVAELIGGLQVLRTRIMALNPQLQEVNGELADPVQEDCAVIAAHVANGQAELLRIGAAAGWHWRHGRLQPFFARSDAPPAIAGGRGADDIDDLLFSPVSLAAPGLGATVQPTCGEVSCAVQVGDRLLLMATHSLLQLPPELLARNLAAASCDEARERIATAAGLGADPARWPLAIIEVQA